jgi:hypothetical protein
VPSLRPLVDFLGIFVLVLAVLALALTCSQFACLSLLGFARTIWHDLVKNPSLLSAFAASVGVIVALIYNAKNAKQTRLSNSAKMVLDFVNDFNSTQKRAQRRVFAKALRDAPETVDLVAHESPVPDFFLDVSHLTIRGVLDSEMVWYSLGWWAYGYYQAMLQKKVLERSAEDKEAGELLDLLGQLNKILEEIRRKHFPPGFDDKKIERFLDEEVALDDGNGTAGQKIDWPPYVLW